MKHQNLFKELKIYTKFW